METRNKFMKKYLIPITLLIVGIVVGWLINQSTHQPINTSSHQDIHTSETWTCSMHPSIRQSEPGKCPICGMDLIPLENEEDGGDPMEVKMSETAMKLANIQTIRVGTTQPVKEIRLNGKVQADERKKSSQAAHIPGRIEQLLVNFTGDYVQKGQTIAQIYSPELVTAQQELFESHKIKDAQPALHSAAREKLKNWKLTEKQIDEMLVSGKIQERFPLKADLSGIVMERRVSVGDYVMRGAPIYDIVDLSAVWVMFDVYESDIPWVKKGSDVVFTVQSLPGEEFHKKISFIEPILNSATRIATARVEMPNPCLKLKPEMFATGIVKSDLKGDNNIVIPKSAVMWTGERSLVYLKNVTEAGVSFIMQEVTLGPSLGDSYIIKEGLEPGLEVVTNGAFTIDAAAQLAGKTSMMNPSGEAGTAGHNHSDANANSNQQQTSETFAVNNQFKTQLSALLDPYLSLKDALVQTDAKKASSEASQFILSLKKVDMKLVKGEAHNAWMKLLETLNDSGKKIGSSTDVETQRKSFSALSNAYYAAIQQFNVTGLDAYYQFCPMAFNDKGAHWISKNSQIQNPYFGDKMMTCGYTKTDIK